MSRYIDVDDFINYIRTLSIWSKTYEVEALKSLNGLLNQIPAADVRENVRGEWLYLGLDVAGEYMYQCSHCKAIIYEPEFLINYDKAQLLGNRFNYCPNCGAEMRGEKDER